MAAKKKAAAKKRSTDIPLKNIPDTLSRKSYSVELKTEAATRFNAGESADKIAKALGVSARSLVEKWGRTLREGGSLKATNASYAGGKKAMTGENIAAMLRGTLEHALKARDERLNAAALIVEADVTNTNEAAQLAKRIRSFMRQTKT